MVIALIFIEGYHAYTYVRIVNCNRIFKTY